MFVFSINSRLPKWKGLLVENKTEGHPYRGRITSQLKLSQKPVRMSTHFLYFVRDAWPEKTTMAMVSPCVYGVGMNLFPPFHISPCVPLLLCKHGKYVLKLFIYFVYKLHCVSLPIVFAFDNENEGLFSNVLKRCGDSANPFESFQHLAQSWITTVRPINSLTCNKTQTRCDAEPV